MRIWNFYRGRRKRKATKGRTKWERGAVVHKWCWLTDWYQGWHLGSYHRELENGNGQERGEKGRKGKGRE